MKEGREWRGEELQEKWEIIGVLLCLALSKEKASSFHTWQTEKMVEEIKDYLNKNVL